MSQNGQTRPKKSCSKWYKIFKVYLTILKLYALKGLIIKNENVEVQKHKTNQSSTPAQCFINYKQG